MVMVDVIVLGVGVFGLLVVYCCVKVGVKVCVIDLNGVVVGVLGGVVGVLVLYVVENWNVKKVF